MRSADALKRLAAEVRTVRDREQTRIQGQSRWNWIKETWHPSSRLAILKVSFILVPKICL